MTDITDEAGNTDSRNRRIEITQTPRSKMLTWPNTVSEQRMTQAQDGLAIMAQAIEEGIPLPTWITSEQASDMAQLIVSQETENFQRLAASSFTKITVNLTPEDDPIRQMFFITQQGTTADTVGLMLETKADAGTEAGTGTTLRARSFTRLNRHPQWAGFNPSLERLKGTDVMLYESREHPGDPHMVAAVESDLRAPYPHETTFPEGLPTVLRNLALWHGALTCTWVPNSDTPTRPRMI